MYEYKIIKKLSSEALFIFGLDQCCRNVINTVITIPNSHDWSGGLLFCSRLFVSFLAVMGQIEKSLTDDDCKYEHL